MRFAFLFSMMKSFSEVVYDITDYINHHIYIVSTDGLPFPKLFYFTLVTCQESSTDVPKAYLGCNVLMTRETLNSSGTFYTHQSALFFFFTFSMMITFFRGCL